MENHQGRRVEHKQTPSASQNRKRRKRRNPRRTAATVGKVLGTLCLIGVLSIGIFAWIFMQYVKTTLAPDLNIDLDDFTMNLSSVILYEDDNGQWQELETLFGTENRIWVDYENIPKYAWQAAVAIEDERFFEHHGVDWKRTGGAVVNMFFGMRNTFGGSTITQQVIKNLTEEDSVTVKRKVTEIFRALELEKKYDKEDILEVYLNKVFFGSSAYGIGAAAKTYFGKEVQDLTLAECASIIAITNNPSKYNPLLSSKIISHDTGKKDKNGDIIYEDWTCTQWNKYRQELILDKMLELGMIDQEEHDAAVAEKLIFVGTPEYEALHGDPNAEEEESTDTGAWSYFVDLVFEDVKEALMDEFGYSAETAVDLIYNAGYRIYATVDPEIQEIAESVYEDVSNLDYQAPNGDQLQSGITIMDPYNGYVVASVGGIGEKTGKRTLSYATAKRPCGSAIKPLSVYGPAIENGVITPASVYDDYPLELNSRGTGGYPKNDPSRYRGLVTLSTAVKYSVNTVAVRVIQELGYATSYDYMVNKLNFGLAPQDLAEAPLAMGGFTYGVSTQEMAAGYCAFINDGIYTKPRTFIRIEDDNGNVILDNEAESWVAFSDTTAYQINNLLKEVMQSGTGTLARISGMTTAGKTGTTSDNFDRYFVGYTPYYCAAVWVGYGYNRTVRVNGGNPAAILWYKVMSQVHEGLENKDFNTPSSGLETITVCTKSGLKPGEGCPTQRVTITAGNGPTETCTMHATVEVCTESGQLAGEFCPAECRETRTVCTYERKVVYLPTGATTIDSETGESVVTGTPILAEDSDQMLSSLQAGGTCTVHTEPVVDPNNPLDPNDPNYDPNNPDQTVDPNDPDYDPNNPNPPVDPGTDPGTNPDTPETPDEPSEPNVPDEPGGDNLGDWLGGLLGN